MSAFEVTDFDNSAHTNHSLLLSEVFYRFSLGHAQRKSANIVHPFIVAATKRYFGTLSARQLAANEATFSALSSHDNSMENMYYGSNNFINYAPG